MGPLRFILVATACIGIVTPVTIPPYRNYPVEGSHSLNEPVYAPREQYVEDPKYSGPNPDNYIAQPNKYRSQYQHDDLDYEEDSGNAIPGEPGKDYPVLSVIPSTSFSCSDKLPGFYADDQAHCQVWHYCKTDGIRESFLCPNGTIYNQLNRVCEWWFNVHCESAASAYKINEDLYIVPPRKPGKGYNPKDSKSPPANRRYRPSQNEPPASYNEAASAFQDPSYS